MNITDRVSVSNFFWWIVGVALLTAMMPIGAVLYKSAPTSWYWFDLDSDTGTLIAVFGFLILIWAAIVFISTSSRIIIKGNRNDIQARIEPFMRSKRIIQLKDIGSMRIRKFNTVGDFGGVGYRKTFGKSILYVLSVEGIALEMNLKTGKKFTVEITNEKQ